MSLTQRTTRRQTEQTIDGLRVLLRGAEAQIAALRKRVALLEAVAPRTLPVPLTPPDAPARKPEPDLSETYKSGDRLRPNPDGSVTLLRDTGTIARFRPICTWDREEISTEIRRLLAEDRPWVVSRRREEVSTERSAA